MGDSRTSYKYNAGRRRFLGQVAGAVAPLILPSGVLGIQGRAGANERVVTGHVGLGYRGRELLKKLGTDAGALCDVDARQMKLAGPLAGTLARAHRDYREVLDRKDIDAVVIATPDHWHAIQAVHACEAGKDVYVETPLGVCLEDLEFVIEAARRFESVVQTGAGGPLTPAGRAAAAYVSGLSGAVSQVECWGEDNPVGGDPALRTTPPPDLDWDRWLGPASWAHYNPDRVHGNFRWMFETGGGKICHQGDHCFAMALACLPAADWEQVSVTASGTRPTRGLWDCPLGMTAEFLIQPGSLRMTWTQSPGRGAAVFGVTFQSAVEHVTVETCDDRANTSEKVMHATRDSRAGSAETALENWLRCIRTRETPALHLGRAAQTATLCLLGNLAYRLGRPLVWNARTKQFAGDEQADRLRRRLGRGEFDF